MGFKLGTERGNHAISGEIKTKLRFHRESGDPDVSVPGTPVIRKDLGGNGVLAEANNDGSIYIDENIEPNSILERQIIMHEMVHCKDMKTGKLAYTDYSVTWDGVNYPREKGMILYEGEWLPEGDKNFPWEQMPWE